MKPLEGIGQEMTYVKWTQKILIRDQENSFHNEVHQMPEQAVASPSLKMVKVQLDKALHKLL